MPNLVFLLIPGITTLVQPVSISLDYWNNPGLRLIIYSLFHCIYYLNIGPFPKTTQWLPITLDKAQIINMPHKPLHDLSLLSSLPLSHLLLPSYVLEMPNFLQSPNHTLLLLFLMLLPMLSLLHGTSFPYITYDLKSHLLINPLGPSFEFHTRVYNGSQREIWKLLNTQNILLLWYWTHCLIIYVWLSEFFEDRYCFLSTFFTLVTSLTYRLIFLLFNYCHNDAM